MSKMNEVSREDEERYYDEFVEYQRQQLRLEGAEELRQDILREISKHQSRTGSASATYTTLQLAYDIVEKASI